MFSKTKRKSQEEFPLKIKKLHEENITLKVFLLKKISTTQ